MFLRLVEELAEKEKVTEKRYKEPCAVPYNFNWVELKRKRQFREKGK